MYAHPDTSQDEQLAIELARQEMSHQEQMQQDELYARQLVQTQLDEQRQSSSVAAARPQTTDDELPSYDSLSHVPDAPQQHRPLVSFLDPQPRPVSGSHSPTSSYGSVYSPGSPLLFHIYRQGWRNATVWAADKTTPLYYLEYPFQFIGPWTLILRRWNATGPVVFQITKQIFSWDFEFQDPSRRTHLRLCAMGLLSIKVSYASLLMNSMNLGGPMDAITCGNAQLSEEILHCMCGLQRPL